VFEILFGDGLTLTATARWCDDDRMGVEFSEPLELDDSGRIAMLAAVNGASDRGSDHGPDRGSDHGPDRGLGRGVDHGRMWAAQALSA
jgi:hypothetical protein